MSHLNLEHVSKKFGSTSVLREIDLAIKERELIVFVGPSGCGKSTLLRIIAGLEEASSGNIIIDGRDVGALDPVDRGVAMVFQSYALYPHLSVYENIAFPLRVQRMEEEAIRERVMHAAEVLHLTEKLKLRPGKLSGGQRQRVAIGRCIVREPKVFLFDEPLSNLDASLRNEMRVELSQLHRKLRTTMILVTHDQVEAMTMADRIAVINEGRLEQFGAPMTLYHHPASRFVAAFIGQHPMNFLSGVIAETAPEGVGVHLKNGIKLVMPVAPGSARRGDRIELGIRPEHVSLGVGFEMNVVVLEKLGGVSVAHGFLDPGEKFCAALPGSMGVKEGKPVSLTFSPRDAHLFTEDGRAFRRLAVAETEQEER